MFLEVASALHLGADEVGLGRVLLHSVDLQEQEGSAIPAAKGGLNEGLNEKLCVFEDADYILGCLFKADRNLGLLGLNRCTDTF